MLKIVLDTDREKILKSQIYTCESKVTVLSTEDFDKLYYHVNGKDRIHKKIDTIMIDNLIFMEV